MVTLLLDEADSQFTLNKDKLHFLDLAIKHGNKDVAVTTISHDRSTQHTLITAK